MRKFRLYIQILFTALTNGYILGFVKGKIYQGRTKAICVPGLNCYSCPGATFSCPIGSLQAVIGHPNYKFSFYIIGFLMVVGVVLGRIVCGFLCPFGLVQDLLDRIPVKKVREFKWDRPLRNLKYLILIVLVFLLPMSMKGIAGSVPYYCKYLCPSGTLFAGIPLIVRNPILQLSIGSLTFWKIGLLAVILISSIFITRPFCKYLCPLGAIYGILNRFSLYQYRVDNRCISCNACTRACPMGISIYKEANSPECIRCGKCVDICPTHAISAGFAIDREENLERKSE